MLNLSVTLSCSVHVNILGLFSTSTAHRVVCFTQRNIYIYKTTELRHNKSRVTETVTVYYAKLNPKHRTTTAKILIRYNEIS
jgi:hypothetical protein